MTPDDDALRVTLGLSALAGGAVWGLYQLATRLLAGQPVHRQDLILAALNVACGITAGALAAYFLGPALGGMIPLEGLREPHALGFGVGALAWELAPFAYKAARFFAEKRAGGGL